MRALAKDHREQYGTRLDSAIKPSSEVSVDWPNVLRQVFNVECDETAIMTLKHLVKHRNKAAHGDLIYAPHVSSETAMWFLSARAFIYQIALGVHATLKNPG